MLRRSSHERLDRTPSLDRREEDGLGQIEAGELIDEELQVTPCVCAASSRDKANL
jgi:hypothetical protein